MRHNVEPWMSLSMNQSFKKKCFGDESQGWHRSADHHQEVWDWVKTPVLITKLEWEKGVKYMARNRYFMETPPIRFKKMLKHNSPNKYTDSNIRFAEA